MKNVISLGDHMIKRAIAEIDEKEEMANADQPDVEELSYAIQLGIEDGKISLKALTQVVLNLADALDVAEYRILRLEEVLGLRLKEASLKGDNVRRRKEEL